MNSYAGIGSRRTPGAIKMIMTKTANHLQTAGWHLRTGGADGADRAFSNGARDENKTIFLPWAGFNNYGFPDGVVLSNKAREEAENIASKEHPAWHNCSRGARALHARNVAILLGGQLDDPVKAVLCWTPNGKTVGGTGMGIRIARSLDIPVMNLEYFDWQKAVDYLTGKRSMGNLKATSIDISG